jgi:hypothetical protein
MNSYSGFNFNCNITSGDHGDCDGWGQVEERHPYQQQSRVHEDLPFQHTPEQLNPTHPLPIAGPLSDTSIGQKVLSASANSVKYNHYI